MPFSAGASNDAIARAIAPPLSKRIGSSFIVENRPGAASVIGNDAVAKSPPDGSVLLLTSSTFLTVAATSPETAVRPDRRVRAGGDCRAEPVAARRVGSRAFQDDRRADRRRAREAG